MEWRYIPFKHYEPGFKTGLNSAAIESVSETGQPIIFLAGWSPGCVNIGYSQEVEEEIDKEEFEKRDLELVRRQGGGGTTYLTEEGEITWHIIVPKDYFPGDVNRIYEKVCGEIAEALEALGIEAEHEPINDVVSEKGKLSGATLKQEKGVIYVAGTLIYETDPEEMFTVLTPNEDKKKDKQIEEFEERVSSVSKESDASFDDTRQALKQKLLEDKNWTESSWKETERKSAEKLADKYSSEEWIYRE
ncbi:MAG: lipoate--protein ligase family protein [Nanohaloarchaea archaeon]|nr:lipoate--protein ligase family protein [Candidatus Nanohaloarchaea archaeon]